MEVTKVRYILLAVVIFMASIIAAAQTQSNDIVFYSSSPGMRSQIYSIRADGGGQVNLSNDPSAWYVSPDWSPDGTRIVYARNGQIWVMNADGTNRIQLTVTGVGGKGWPVWSPDGSKIAYLFDGNGFEPPSINVMNADGSNERLLTFTDSFKRIDWSPNGDRIAFSALGGPGCEYIYVINADGTGQPAIVNSKLCGSNVHPKWSPDGSKIAFTTYGDLNFGSAVICTMNADGSDTACNAEDFTRDNYYPSWSPDGSRLTFSGFSHETGFSQIYVMNADGTNLTQVTQNGRSYSAPNWKRAAPSSQHLLSGRVTTSSQQGVPRARVTLDDGAGNLRHAITNPFGYFRFREVSNGTYTVTITSKSYMFTSRVVDVSSSITDLDFTALKNP